MSWARCTCLSSVGRVESCGNKNWWMMTRRAKGARDGRFRSESLPAKEVQNLLFALGWVMSFSFFVPVAAHGVESVSIQSDLLSEVATFAQERKSSHLMISLAGETILNQRWRTDDHRERSKRYRRLHRGATSEGDAVEDVASVQKSVVATLLIRALRDGLVSVDAPVSDYLSSGWSHSKSEEAITIRHLLSMTSGLTSSLHFSAEPGTQWGYNTGAYAQLIHVLEAISGQNIHTLTDAWLTGPLGMSDSRWVLREGSVNTENSYGFVTTAPDLIKFGRYVLDQVEDPLQAKSVASSQPFNPAYGWLWWLNGQEAKKPERPALFKVFCFIINVSACAGDNSARSLVPNAPSDLFAAQGALGRKLFIVPSLDLVVVRLGAGPGADFNIKLWDLIMRALSLEPLCGPCTTPLALRKSEVKAADGNYISWREHIIDDASLGVADLSGSDGLVLADLDQDGYEDIVSVHESDTIYDGQPIGHVRIAWGGPDPHRWRLSTLASGHEAAAAEDVTVADFDGDGDLDVVVACELAHLIYFQNPGAGARSQRWERRVIANTQDRGSYIRVFAGDFDADGRQEVVAANKGAQNPDVTKQSMDAISIYSPGRDLLSDSVWPEQVLGKFRVPINSEPVDLDGDGDLDIVAGARGEQRIFWFENHGAQRFELKPIEVVNFPEALSLTGFNMDYADLDGDDRTDIVSSAWPGRLILLRQPKDLEQSWSWSLLGRALPDQLVSVRLADIDGDGDLDAFAGAYSRGPRGKDDPLGGVSHPAGRIVWFENPGESSATQEWQRHDISRRKRGMYDKWVARDLDGDGDLDFLGTRGNSEPFDGVIWLEQIRSREATRVFVQARASDSEQLTLAAEHE